VRIWALRESRLPVRITVWDPRETQHRCGPELLKQQPTSSSIQRIRVLLRSRRHQSLNLAYAFLKDPGGRAITPEEMFAGSGYHLPVIEQAGITPDGGGW